MINASSRQRWLPRWKNHLKKSTARLGLMLTGNDIAWAHVDMQGAALAVKAFGYLQEESQDAAWSRFRHVVQQQRLQGLPLHAVMSPADYQLLLMEAADVPDEELREAMRWRLGDFISFPAAEAAIDIFTLPEDAYRGRQRMLYTAVCQQRHVDALRNRAESLKLPLASVSIPEISLCRLERYMLEEEGSTALLQPGAGGSLLGIFQGHALYLARQMTFSPQTLAAAQYDNVLLEIQRSLDYFDSQIGKGMVKRLLIAPFFNAEPLTAHLAANLDVPVRPLDLSPLWPAAGMPADTAQLASCLPAVGAALRGIA